MARFKCILSLVVLSGALMHCNRNDRSERRAEGEQRFPPSATATEKMTPASGTLTQEEKNREAQDERSRQATGEALSDAQIIKLVDQANGAEVDEGKFAETKAQHAKVKSFAAKMVLHHGQGKQKVEKLATKLSLTPADSSLSTKMKSESDSSLTDLKAAATKDFDRAYIDAQIAEHKKVLSTLDDKLIPAAKDAELKSLLRETRSTVNSHLMEAQQIQTDMQGKPEPR